jgi:hypothetical protein
MVQKILSFIRKFRARIIFYALGLGSLVWFLVRVIPKPSRASYPCMKAATPLAASFVTYLIGITSFTFLFRKAQKKLVQSKILLAAVLIVFGLAAGTVAVVTNNSATYASDYQGPQTGNEPIGIGKGVFPGRVVWAHDVDATDENCPDSDGEYWYQDTHTNTNVVKSMLSEGLQKLSGTTSDAEAWDAIFHNFNNAHGRGDQGYTAGEKIVIKVNMNAIWYGDAGINTSPQVCYALLDQLINVVGAAQADISIGDPNITLTSGVYEKCHTAFPNVKYWRANGASAPSGTSANVIFTSDGSASSKLPQAYVDAAYLFNVPVLKKHHRGGISVCSKNHFGSMSPYTSIMNNFHPSLPVPDAHESGQDPNPNYGVYRCFVDIMGHKDLGGKTVLYLVDGLWSSVNWGHPSIKWRMTPFNNDYPNSLFLSQDPVAIESVCYDFLYQEFDENHPTEGDPATTDKGPFPRFKGTDDFLHQAADPTNWPSDIDYDPENDGSVLTSMGTHEHWNNYTDKLYSRNLGTGEGIELISDFTPVALQPVNYIPEGFAIRGNYPNPFSSETVIEYTVAEPSYLRLQISDISGKIIYRTDLGQKLTGEFSFTWDGSSVPAGQYFCTIRVTGNDGYFNLSNKMLISR